MEKKINIIEIIKDCPIGTKLYSPLCGECRILSIYDGLGFDVICGDNTIYNFSYDGRYNIMGECCIFPSKECRDWSKFQRPFKDGDILISGLDDCGNNPFIFKQTNGIGNAQCYCAIDCFEQLTLNNDNWTPIKGCRFATEEEKQKLFQVIEDNGYKWNAETKTLVKLPKFKVGNKIKSKISKNIFTVIDIRDGVYILSHVNDRFGYHVHFYLEKDYELIPNKFDIDTLKPLKSEVLVRDSIDGMWKPSFWGKYIEDSNYKYLTTNGSWKQCIPYKGNEHLLGTSNDCVEYYKLW